jgi:hypothetical protein
MTRVAEKTGLERTHLYRKLKQLGVELGKNKGSESSIRLDATPLSARDFFGEEACSDRRPLVMTFVLRWPGSSVGRAAD